MEDSQLRILKGLSPCSALSIPFMALRNHIHELSKEIVYAVRGPASPKINLLGAYLLNEAGHTAYVLAEDPA